MKSDESEVVDSNSNPVHSENEAEIDYELQMLFSSILAELYHSQWDHSGNPELLNSSEDWRLFDKLMKKLMMHTHEKRGEPINLSRDEERFLLKATINSTIFKKND